ncbi:MAG: TIGR01777 family oxidoreductase [Bdellovibrionota bacterium]
MKKAIVVTGATGFVGRKLCLELLKKGYELKIISRDTHKAKEKLPFPASFLEWNGVSPLAPGFFENTYAVLHLAGEPIADRRWSPEIKKAIEESRSKGTAEVIKAINGCLVPPKILVGTSAIGIYGNRNDELLSEESSHGDSFLARVCEGWEKSYSGFQGRLAVLRASVVLGYGGALEKMLPPFRMGVGGKLDSGKQWMSWIHHDDLVRMYIYALENDSVSGVFNATAPGHVTNAEFTKAMGKALSRPALFPVPGFVLKIMFGEMSSVLLDSQKVSAEKIVSNGFKFLFPDITNALSDLLKPMGKTGGYVQEGVKWIPYDQTRVYSFFSEAKNLETITPPWLHFKIQKLSTPQIEQGTLIDYKLKIKGVPVRWRTLISSWYPKESFVDEQLKGPYKLWHHTHRFSTIDNGTLMTDRVVYQMPFGILGDFVRLVMVHRDIKTIFAYRSKVIESLFH